MRTKSLLAAAATAVALLAVAATAAVKNAPDLSAVPAGYRAATLPLPADRLVFVKKGDRVDVLVTFEAIMDDNHKEKVTATILQNVLVLSVDKPGKPEDKGSIELVVNPNEGQYAALALHQGEVDLLVRAEGETQMHPMEMASFRKLFK